MDGRKDKVELARFDSADLKFEIAGRTDEMDERKQVEYPRFKSSDFLDIEFKFTRFKVPFFIKFALFRFCSAILIVAQQKVDAS